MDSVDDLCRTLTNVALPFGGIPFLGIGDFRQVAPVVKGTGPSSALQASIKSSDAWLSFNILRLHTPIRSAQDPAYTASVDEIGENYVQRTVVLDMLGHLATVDDCIDFLFPENVLAQPLSALKRAFLSPKNIHVDDFNSNVLDRVPGHDREYRNRIA
jgi:hypothetical protein